MTRASLAESVGRTCAEEPAPHALVGSYKDACLSDPGHERGTCVALTKVDGVFKTCKQAVCSRGEAAQLCDTHLRAPTIVMGDDDQDGIIAYKRFCVTCDGLRELQGFRGFLAHCGAHSQGRSDCGPPVLPKVVDGEQLVVRTRDKCATLVFGKTPHGERKAMTICDVIGCAFSVFASSGLCEDHCKVCPPSPIVTCALLVRWLLRQRSSMSRSGKQRRCVGRQSCINTRIVSQRTVSAYSTRVRFRLNAF